MPGGRPKGASVKSEAAFHAYAAMGPTRSLVKLANLLVEHPSWADKPPKIRLLQAWSSKYKWQDRVKEYDAAVEEERRIIREERIVDTNEEQYTRSKALLDKMLTYAEDMMDDGKLGGQATVQLIKILADLQRLAVRADVIEQFAEKDKSIRIVIETDNTPNPPLPSATIKALPAPTIETVVEAEVSEES